MTLSRRRLLTGAAAGATLICAPSLVRGAGAVNVLAYGADPTGVNDSTAAFANALAAMPANGAFHVPAGLYRVSSFTASKAGTYFGDGPHASIIATPNATGDLVTISSSFIEVYGLGFQSLVPRTSGAYVSVLSTAPRFRLERYEMFGAFVGVRTQAEDVKLKSGHMLDTVATVGIGVLVDDGLAILIDDLVMDAGAKIAACISVTKTGDLSISNSQLLNATSPLLLTASAGSVIASVSAIDTFCDHGSSGVVIRAAGGHIVRSQFLRCWFGSHHDHGVIAETSAGGTVDGIDFAACQFVLNGANGLSLADAGVSNVRVQGGVMAENAASGFGAFPGAQHFSMIGTRAGRSDGLRGNGYGVNLVGGNDYFNVSENDLTGNVMANLVNGNPAAPTRILQNNLT